MASSKKKPPTKRRMRKKTAEEIRQFLALIWRLCEGKRKLENHKQGVINFLAKESGMSKQKVGKYLKILSDWGYLQRQFSREDKRFMVALDNIDEDWQGTPNTNIISSIANPRLIKKKEFDRHRFIVLADFSNISEGLRSSSKAINKIIEAEQTLREIGSIEAKFVFVPEHKIDEAHKLSTFYRYFMVICPCSSIQNGKQVFKDKDTVDNRIGNLVNIVALFSDSVNYIAIIGGDGDFADAAVYARDHGKKVMVIAPQGGLSDALERVADDLILI